MAYKITISQCGTWIQVSTRRSMNMESALEFLTVAAQAGADHDVCRFLLDVREVANTKRPYHDYEIVHHHLPALGFDHQARVALLVSPGDETHDFFELAATNAHLQWRVLTDKEEAVRWLTEAESSRDLLPGFNSYLRDIAGVQMISEGTKE